MKVRNVVILEKKEKKKLLVFLQKEKENKEKIKIMELKFTINVMLKIVQQKMNYL